MTLDDPTPKPAYHHGDLRTALLDAAEAELSEVGVENFSLRACARRAGVSHAAPKHHFGSAVGLLDALAAVGFRRLAEVSRQHMQSASPAPNDQLLASGCGYVAFAQANPALFKLMFSARRKAGGSAELSEAGAEAFGVLQQSVAGAMPGSAPERVATQIAACWSIVHGLAHLLIENPPAIGALMAGRPVEEMVAEILGPILPVSAKPAQRLPA